MKSGRNAPSPADDPQFASTLARGLEVLRCFSASDPILGNKDIAERTQLSRPTVVRLTHTLTELNYLRRVPGTLKYELGSAVLSLVYPLLARINLRRVASLQMNELAKHSRGWVSIGVRDRTDMVYVETVHTGASPHLKRDIGQTFPIITSAMGHAYLASLDAQPRERLLHLIRIKSPRDWAQGGSSFQSSLVDFHSRGFCVRRGGASSPHVHTVAVPLTDPEKTETVVFNCAVPFRLLRRGQLENDLGPRLVGLVRSIENTLSSGNIASGL